MTKIGLTEQVEVPELYLDTTAHLEGVKPIEELLRAAGPTEVEHLLPLPDIVVLEAALQEHLLIEVQEVELEATVVVQEVLHQAEVGVHTDQVAQAEAVEVTVHREVLQEEVLVATEVLVDPLDHHIREAGLLEEAGHQEADLLEVDQVVAEVANKLLKFH